MAPQLHIANKRYSSWSMVPWTILKALSIPFDEHLHLFASSSRQPHFTFSPALKVPCLVDGDITVWDSLAIIEYIADTYPAAWPNDRAARAWARSAAAEMHSAFVPLRDAFSMNLGLRLELLGEMDEDVQRDLDRLSDIYEEGIQKFGGPFLAGSEFTGVDALFVPNATRVKTYGLHLRGENARKYVATVLAHPAVREWVDQGVRETEREEVHEVMAKKGKRVLEEY